MKNDSKWTINESLEEIGKFSKYITWSLDGI